MRIILTLGEIQELRAKRVAEVYNALEEILKVESFLKDGTFKNTKKILFQELEKAINIGK